MPIFRFLMFLLLFMQMNFVCVFGQQKIPSKEELHKLSYEAGLNYEEGHFEKSLVQARQLLSFSILSKNYSLAAEAYNTIAANFDELEESEKAFFYYNKSLHFAEKSKNEKLKKLVYNNLGNIYCFDKKQYKKGILYYQKSLDLSIEQKDTYQACFTKLNITWAYFDIGDYTNGYPYLKAVNSYQNLKKDPSLAVALNMLNGMYSGFIKENLKAHDFFQKSIKLGLEGSEKSDLCYAYQEYSKFLNKIGDYRDAYKYLNLYQNLDEELRSEEKLKKVKVAGINLELDEYKRELEKIDKSYKTKQQLFKAEQNRNKKIVSVVLLLFIIIVILFYFLYQNARLRQKNRLKDIQRKIQLNIINASIDGQESERKKIASFLHDNVSAMLSSAGLHLNAFSSQTEIESDEIIKTKAILQNAHDKVRDLSHELLPTLLVRFGLLFAIEDLCEKNSNSVLHFQFSSNVSIKKRYNERFEIRVYFIISELLNNIIKHSQAQKAKVILNEINGRLIVTVYDDGKGFDAEKLNSVEGFGLNRIRARIKKLRGNFAIKSIVDEGTTVQIKVPISY